MRTDPCTFSHKSANFSPKARVLDTADVRLIITRNPHHYLSPLLPPFSLFFQRRPIQTSSPSSAQLPLLLTLIPIPARATQHSAACSTRQHPFISPLRHHPHSPSLSSPPLLSPSPARPTSSTMRPAQLSHADGAKPASCSFTSGRSGVLQSIFSPSGTWRVACRLERAGFWMIAETAIFEDGGERGSCRRERGGGFP